jgi:UPF0755 protein
VLSHFGDDPGHDEHVPLLGDGSDDRVAPVRSRFSRSCLPVLIVLVVLVGGAWMGGRWAFEEISTRLAPPPDYAGPGTGSVLFEVETGASSVQIGRGLKSAEVVKSVDAFADAARKEDKSRNIQVGYYQLKKQMKASEALSVLVDPANLLQSLVVVPEGARVDQVVAAVVEETDISRKDVTAALANPAAIGLPAEARGNPEGYLYPATYTVPPKRTASDLIKEMVAKTLDVERSLDIATRAAKLGLTPQQVLTVASILEYEVNSSKDYPKVARVIYNRLDRGMKLEMDSTVAFISKRTGDVFTTAQERASRSPYNTYRYTGLPPGPIGSPGKSTIEAALSPATGDWLFFVADYEANTTRFSETLDEHSKWVAKLQEYCRDSEDC